MGKTVKQVDWQRNEVTVYTTDNERYQANKLLITLPAGLLQKKMDARSINITPALDRYDAAWQKIGYGSALKIILCFKEAFWKTEKENIGFIFSEEAIPTWWTQLPSEAPMLTGWLGGPAAVQWDLMDDETVLEHALVSLTHIFRKEAGEIAGLLVEHHIFRWHAFEAAVGAYSFETPLSADAKKILTTPIEDTIYFAGEALYTGAYQGTVEASLNSAVEVAKKMIAANPD
jgi:monoamine oxidase